MIDSNVQITFEVGDFLVISQHMGYVHSVISHLLVIEIKHGLLYCLTHFVEQGRVPRVLTFTRYEVEHFT